LVVVEEFFAYDCGAEDSEAEDVGVPEVAEGCLEVFDGFVVAFEKVPDHSLFSDFFQFFNLSDPIDLDLFKNLLLTE